MQLLDLVKYGRISYVPVMHISGNDFRIHEKLMVHCQDAKAAIFQQLCDKFLQCVAFESTERTHVSTVVKHYIACVDYCYIYIIY